uniref:Uncharacterized protein n=1 Tax=Globodera pallida TaxID=36090 RepID=A0A183C943_GLOPA
MAPRKETEEEKSERQAKEGKKLPWHTPGTARGRPPSVQILPSGPPAPTVSFGGFDGTVRVARGEQPGTSGDPAAPPTGEYDRLVDLRGGRPLGPRGWTKRILKSLPRPAPPPEPPRPHFSIVIYPPPRSSHPPRRLRLTGGNTEHVHVRRRAAPPSPSASGDERRRSGAGRRSTAGAEARPPACRKSDR